MKFTRADLISAAPIIYWNFISEHHHHSHRKIENQTYPMFFSQIAPYNISHVKNQNQKEIISHHFYFYRKTLYIFLLKK